MTLSAEFLSHIYTPSPTILLRPQIEFVGTNFESERIFPLEALDYWNTVDNKVKNAIIPVLPGYCSVVQAPASHDEVYIRYRYALST